MKVWRRLRGMDGEDTARRRMEIVQAQRRLEDVESKVALTVPRILARHERNHWSEAIRRVVRGDGA